MIIARTGEEERRWFESREDDSDEGNGTSALSKTILEWLFLAIAVFLLCSIFARRYAVMKRANQPISQFFRAAPQWASPPRPSRAVPCSQPCPRSVVYAEPFPSAHLSSVVYAAPLQRPRRSRRTRGAGTDARGRRLESGENDHDSFDDKDVLPAYETIGGPPRYDELAVPLPVALAGHPPTLAGHPVTLAGHSATLPDGHGPPAWPEMHHDLSASHDDLTGSHDDITTTLCLPSYDSPAHSDDGGDSTSTYERRLDGRRLDEQGSDERGSDVRRSDELPEGASAPARALYTPPRQTATPPQTVTPPQSAIPPREADGARPPSPLDTPTSSLDAPSSTPIVVPNPRNSTPRNSTPRNSIASTIGMTPPPPPPSPSPDRLAADRPLS